MDLCISYFLKCYHYFLIIWPVIPQPTKPNKSCSHGSLQCLQNCLMCLFTNLFSSNLLPKKSALGLQKKSLLFWPGVIWGRQRPWPPLLLACLVMALVPLQKWLIHFQSLQWKCPLQNESGLALSKIKFQARYSWLEDVLIRLSSLQTETRQERIELFINTFSLIPFISLSFQAIGHLQQPPG